MGIGITKRGDLLRLFPSILKGQRVRDQGGHVLGRVVSTGEFNIEIRHGILFPLFYFLNYVEITSAFGGSLYVARGKSALRPLTLSSQRPYPLRGSGSQTDSNQRKAS